MPAPLPAFMPSTRLAPPVVPPVIAAVEPQFVARVEPPPTQRWSAPAEPALAASPTDDWSATVARTPISLKDLEERFAGRALAWVGGIALVAAAIFFLSLAFSRGWITEPMRVAIGLTAGIAAFVAGAVLLARKNPLVGNVLAGVGLGVVSVSLFAATRLYGLMPPEAGLAGALVAAIAAAAVAVRYDARSVAAFGLIAALIAPPVMGASPTLLTLLFVAVTLAGSTAVALFRSWRWLPSLAFVLAAPQLASWLAGDPDTTQAVVALTGFWLVNIIAAAGEEVRIRRDDLRPSSAILVLANATFLLWGIFVVLRRQPRRLAWLRDRARLARAPARGWLVPVPAGLGAPLRQPCRRHRCRPPGDRGLRAAGRASGPGGMGGRGGRARLACRPPTPPLVGGRGAHPRGDGDRAPRRGRVSAVGRPASRPRRRSTRRS